MPKVDSEKSLVTEVVSPPESPPEPLPEPVPESVPEPPDTGDDDPPPQLIVDAVINTKNKALKIVISYSLKPIGN
jgi:hypothetical protein